MATNENILKAILIMENRNLNPSSNSMILKFRLQMIGVNLQCALDYELPPAKLSDHLKDCFEFISLKNHFIETKRLTRWAYLLGKKRFPFEPIWLLRKRLLKVII